MSFIPNQTIEGIPQADYIAPIKDWIDASIPISILSETGAILTNEAGGAASPGFAVPIHDDIDFTYNANKDVETVTYLKDGGVVATLTFSYNADNRITQIVET